jgi:RNA polymerase sigma-70 factor, ECF subfamily
MTLPFSLDLGAPTRAGRLWVSPLRNMARHVSPERESPTLPSNGSEPLHVTSGVRAVSDPADEAMDRYAEGDERAFRDVYQLLAPPLRLFLRRLTGSMELAEDLTQETLLKIHGARGAFVSGRKVKPWAYAIARNCYLSHARTGQNRIMRGTSDVDDCRLQASTPSGEEVTIAEETARIVERTLQNMTAARREAFILLRYEGMSVATAAEVVGATEGALKIRAFHAYEAIRKALHEAQGTAKEST